MASTRSVLAAWLLVVAACAGPTPTASPDPTMATVPSVPGPQPTPTATTSPVPAVATVPPNTPTPYPSGAPYQGQVPETASAEFGGARLTIAVGHNPIDAVFGSILTVTIDNRSQRRLEWWADGCGGNAAVSGTTMSTWRDSVLDVPSGLATYRDWLRRDIPVDEPIELDLHRPYSLLHRGTGCAKFATRHRLEPGDSVTREFIWDGSAAKRLGPAPNGPVVLTARLERWKLLDGDDLRPLEVSLDSFVVGGRPEEFLSPFEAIDVALADARLSSWLLTRPLDRTQQPIVEFDRQLGLWAVGSVFDGDLVNTLHAAFIDPITREIVTVREHSVGF